MICSKCGEEMRMTEKDTSSGRDIREYRCDGCGHSDWEDNGTALWQILHDDREKFLAAAASRNSAQAPGVQPEAPQTGRPPVGSMWKRIIAWLGKGK
ncbi:MAG: hypothetical protein ACLQGT_15985 [Terracidiphilus sp.]